MTWGAHNVRKINGSGHEIYSDCSTHFYTVCGSADGLRAVFASTPRHQCCGRNDFPRPGGQAASGRIAAGAPEPERISRYNVNRKALERWAKERLSLSTAPDGSVEAVFRYEGTTCTNMGRPLAFRYHVKLGPRAQGYPIREQSCAPAPGDTGYTYMCQYLEDSSRLMAAIDREKPLNGQQLEAVLEWQREPSGAGCFCAAASRDHKWGLVLETIHYALNQSSSGVEV